MLFCSSGESAAEEMQRQTRDFQEKYAKAKVRALKSRARVVEAFLVQELWKFKFLLLGNCQNTSVKAICVGNRFRPLDKISRDLDDMLNRSVGAFEQMGFCAGKGAFTKGASGLRGYPASQPRVPRVWRTQCSELPCDPIVFDAKPGWRHRRPTGAAFINCK